LSQGLKGVSISGIKINAHGLNVSLICKPYSLLLNCSTWLAFDPVPGPITASAFNHTGNIFAYAISYDWSKGHSGMAGGVQNRVMLHPCKEDEVKKKKK